jgi:hypothetical protein
MEPNATNAAEELVETAIASGSVTLHDLIGHDPVLAEYVRQASSNDDDPPIVFDWNDDNLVAF